MKKGNIPEEVPFPVTEQNPTYRSFFRMAFYFSVLLKIKLWEDANFVLADIPVRPDAARKILPWYLRPVEPCRATFFFAQYPRTAFTRSYNEAALLLHVRHLLYGKGVHCPWMIVDDDTALIYGRELLGYPKKLADMPFADDGKTISASLTRRDTTVVNIEAERLEKESCPGPVMGVKTFNFSGPGQYGIVNPVWMFRPREVIHDSYKARVNLDIQQSHYDPIARLIGDYQTPLEGRIARINIMGARMLWFAGITGLRIYKNTFNLRFR
ncbi:MAG: acetoacetate decarboxylase family protein [Thermodesulfobacteriota bacterium]|nr:acetoacetate decarboxylase family protein [Thermodesulfobacteriota bacterium]